MFQYFLFENFKKAKYSVFYYIIIWIFLKITFILWINIVKNIFLWKITLTLWKIYNRFWEICNNWLNFLSRKWRLRCAQYWRRLKLSFPSVAKPLSRFILCSVALYGNAFVYLHCINNIKNIQQICRFLMLVGQLFWVSSIFI